MVDNKYCIWKIDEGDMYSTSCGERHINYPIVDIVLLEVQWNEAKGIEQNCPHCGKIIKITTWDWEDRWR